VADIVARNLQAVRRYVDVPILLENVSPFLRELRLRGFGC
jgi:uncharacterized protein (UPF0276 family)